MIDVIETTSAPKTADPKLSILKPPTRSDVNHKMRALIMKVKRPRVRMLIGRVIKIKKGFMAKLSSPRTIEATMAADKFMMAKPGMKLAATNREMVVTTRYRKMLMSFFVN